MNKNRESMPNIKQILLGRIKKETPSRPGVYLFKDSRGEIIYIGKSVNLKQRMSGYFRNNSTASEDRIRRMIFNVRDFNFHETSSELLALLLEDELIKKYLPYFNIRQKEYISYLYLTLTEEPFPTFRMINHSEKSEVRQLFGPFRDHYFVENILEIIRHFFQIRSCKEPEPTQKCMNHDIGYCRGPCRKKITKEAYSNIVKQAVDFLRGNEKIVMDRLEQTIENSVATQDFEKAAKCRDQMLLCRNFCERQRFIDLFKSKNFIVFENGAKDMTHIFIKGIGSSLNGHLSREKINEIVSNTGAHPEDREDDRYLLDRANILHRWIKMNGSHCQYVFIEPDFSVSTSKTTS